VATIEIYKRNQGKYTRISTFVAGMLIGAIGSGLLGQKIAAAMPYGPMTAYVRYGVPALMILALAALMFWLVNRPSSADFLIATEGEMKKVSWSSRKEIVGSTKVVIITAIIVSMTLLAVDLMFIWVFGKLGVMG
jgi:preprotein translocase subunit SecE